MRQKNGKRHIPLYDLRLPASTISEVRNTLRSGWLSTGPRVQAFEKAITSYVGVKNGVAVSSATAGLVAALDALGVAGHEVITSPFSFVATAEAILRCGARPVFADIDPVTLALDPDEAEKAVTARTACILPVDIGGYPADYRRLRRLARDNAIPVLADASHSLGTEYHGRTIPQVCDAAVFSFHATKNLVCGEGGLVASRDRDFIQRVRLIANHGLTATALERRRSGKWLYDVVALGFKANMSEVHAAVGLGNLPTLKKNQILRAARAERYLNRLAPLAEYIELPPISRYIQPAWHLFVIKLHLSRLRVDRDKFMALMAEADIECGVHFIPITHFSYYRSMVGRKKCLNADRAGLRVVSLPLYPRLALRDVDYVCERVADIVRKYSQ